MSADVSWDYYSTLRDLLLLVGRDLPRATFNGWSHAERMAAEKWATKAYLRASDNNVHVPPLPPRVAALAGVTP